MSGASAQRTVDQMTVTEMVDMAWHCVDGGLLFSAAIWLREAAAKLEVQALARSPSIVTPGTEPVDSAGKRTDTWNLVPGAQPDPECPSSPDGSHQADTSMESGPNNCFYCEADMQANARGSA